MHVTKKDIIKKYCYCGENSIVMCYANQMGECLSKYWGGEIKNVMFVNLREIICELSTPCAHKVIEEKFFIIKSHEGHVVFYGDNKNDYYYIIRRLEASIGDYLYVRDPYDSKSMKILRESLALQ